MSIGLTVKERFQMSRYPRQPSWHVNISFTHIFYERLLSQVKGVSKTSAPLLNIEQVILLQISIQHDGTFSGYLSGTCTLELRE